MFRTLDLKKKNNSGNICKDINFGNAKNTIMQQNVKTLIV